MQELSQLKTTPPYPGADVVADVNKIARTLGTDFAGSDDPAAMAWSYSKWADTGNMLLKRRNAANTAWVVEDYLLMSQEDRCWAYMPIGIPFPIQDHITGVPVPPTNNPHFRYVKLTASDLYNDGALDDETVSGSAPLIVASAEIIVPDSAMLGQRVQLVNTERRSYRPGSPGTLQDDAIQNFTGSVAAFYRASSSVTAGVFGQSVFGSTPAQQGTAGGTPGDNATINIDASRQVRTSTETRIRNQGVNYYMRVK